MNSNNIFKEVGITVSESDIFLFYYIKFKYQDLPFHQIFLRDFENVGDFKMIFNKIKENMFVI